MMWLSDMDTFRRFDGIPACDGQKDGEADRRTDGRTDIWAWHTVRAMHRAVINYLNCSFFSSDP